jgi:hypothetical protein
MAKYTKRETIWGNREKFQNLRQSWYHDPFKGHNAEQVVKTVNKYYAEAQEMKIKTKGEDEVLDELIKEVKIVHQNCNLYLSLGNSAMQTRHWRKVYALLDQAVPGNLDIGITFQGLLDIHADEHAEAIEDISGAAQGEMAIETAMDQVKERWEATIFGISPYRETKDRFILGDIEDLMTQLEDD